jgi:hypothetical protein
MVNYYNKIDELKNEIKPNKNILLRTFKKTLMLKFGFTEKKAEQWINNFEKVQLIETSRIKNDLPWDETNVYINFK